MEKLHNYFCRNNSHCVNNAPCAFIGEPEELLAQSFNVSAERAIEVLYEWICSEYGQKRSRTAIPGELDKAYEHIKNDRQFIHQVNGLYNTDDLDFYSHHSTKSNIPFDVIMLVTELQISNVTMKEWRCTIDYFRKVFVSVPWGRPMTNLDLEKLT